MVGFGCLHDHDSGKGVVQINSDEFLVDELDALAMELLGLQMFFYGFEEFLFVPSEVIELSEFRRQVSFAVEQGGDEDERLCGLWYRDLDNPQSQGWKGLIGVFFEQGFRRRHSDFAISFPASQQLCDFLEHSIFWKAHQKVDALLEHLEEQLITGESPVQKQEVSKTEIIYQFFSHDSFRGPEGTSDEVDWNLGEHVEQCTGDHLWEVGASGGLEIRSQRWSIGEIFEQVERVKKGWFPENPQKVK